MATVPKTWAVGDWNASDTKIVRSVATVGGGPEWRRPLNMESLDRWLEKAIASGNVRGFTAQANRTWEPVGPNELDGITDFDVGTGDDVIRGVTLFENMLFDTSPLSAEGGIVRVTPTTYDDSGNVVNWGFRPEADNYFFCVVSNVPFDTNFQPVAANPWFRLVQLSDTYRAANLSIMFKAEADGFDWRSTIEYFDPFIHNANPGLFRPLGTGENLARVSVLSGGSYVHRVRCTPIPNDGFGRYLIEWWVYIGNGVDELRFQLMPAALRTANVPSQRTRTDGATLVHLIAHNEDDAAVAGRVVSQIASAFGRLMPGPVLGLADVSAQLTTISRLIVPIRQDIANAQADVRQLELRPNSIIAPKGSPGNTGLFDGAVYFNPTAASITIPESTAAAPVVITETYLLGLGLLKATGSAAVVVEKEIAYSSLDFTGKVPDGVKMGIKVVKGEEPVMFFADADGNWTKDEPDAPKSLAEDVAKIKAIAEANKAKLDAVKGNALVMDGDAVRALVLQDREVREIRNLTPPTPLTVFEKGSLNSSVGSSLVNFGRVHDVGKETGYNRHADPVTAQFSFETPASVRQRKSIIRFGLPASLVGKAWIVVESPISGGAISDVEFQNTGSGWSGVDFLGSSYTIAVDNGWVVFSLNYTGNPQGDRRVIVNVPPGPVQCPSIYDDASAAMVDGGFEGLIITDKKAESAIQIKTRTRVVDVDALLAVDQKLSLLLNLEAAPGVVVASGDATWFNGSWWANKSGASVALPAVFDDAWFRSNGFEKSSGAVVSGSREEIVTGVSPNPVSWSAKELKEGIALSSKAIGAILRWDGSATYNNGDLAVDAGVIYRSLAEGSKGFRPSSSPFQWEDTSKVVQADIKLNRAPAASDVRPIGTVWADVRYGEKDPVVYLSKGSGIWEPQNTLTLSYIRIYFKSGNATYTTIENIRVLDKDGADYGRVFLAGARGGSVPGSFTSIGQLYTGSKYVVPGGAGFWFDFEPSSGTKINGVSAIIADYRAPEGLNMLHRVDVGYSNGFSRSFSYAGHQNGANQKRDISPTEIFPVGAAVDIAKKYVLSAAEASDPKSERPGEVTGAVLGRVVNGKMRPPLLPTVQAGLGIEVDIQTVTLPAAVHMNGTGGAVSWSVKDAVDGQWALIMNVGASDDAVALSDYAGAFWRDGKASEEIRDGLLKIRAGQTVLVHVADNHGAKFINAVRYGVNPPSPGDDIAPLTSRVVALESRKEVRPTSAATVVVQGNTLPDPGMRASGFDGDGSGPVDGATSWNAWQALGVDISQRGLEGVDAWEISAGFSAAAAFGEIGFTVGSDSGRFSRAKGLEAGTLDLVEWTSGDWRGVTLRVSLSTFTGAIAFVGLNGSTYIGPVVRKISVDGFAVDGKSLALTGDVKAIADKTRALSTEVVVINENLNAHVSGVDERFSSLGIRTGSASELMEAKNNTGDNKDVPAMWTPKDILTILSPPNLTPLLMGTFLTESSLPLIAFRRGAKIASFGWTFRDRRSGYPTRTAPVTLLSSEMGGTNGWTTRYDAGRFGVYKTFSLGGVAFGALVQFQITPGGWKIWLMDEHSGWNTYGEYVNFTVNWVAE